MRPAFSVIFLTTLIGAGQGLFLALYAVELGAFLDESLAAPEHFFVAGSGLSLALLVTGLAASFFHLGRPERAWRSAAMWRTSWLSREVIVLPAFIAGVVTYGIAHQRGWQATILLGGISLVLCIGLFVCTAMIYACIKFLQEWASPLTLLNFFLLGAASGLMLAAALASITAPMLVRQLTHAAIAATLAALVTRVLMLRRNSRIRPKSNLQTAIGVKHPNIQQKAQGLMGGSFNTREFFHGMTHNYVSAVKWVFLILSFPLPVALAMGGLALDYPMLLVLAFIVQYVGLIAERWFFFAQARHPQNLYYQMIS